LYEYDANTTARDFRNARFEKQKLFSRLLGFICLTSDVPSTRTAGVSIVQRTTRATDLYTARVKVFPICIWAEKCAFLIGTEKGVFIA